MKKIYLIGAGMGDQNLLTEQSRELMKSCSELYAFGRIAQLHEEQWPDINVCSYSEMISAICDSVAESIGVLVSGDTGFFSIAKSLKKQLGESAQMINTCGISSLQYLCSKLQIGYEDIRVISLHGRDHFLAGSIAYRKTTFVLAGSEHLPAQILSEICSAGLGTVTVSIGEFLSMKEERIVTGTAEELAKMEFDPLSVLLFQNEHPAEKEMPLFDEDFIRDEVPMTKQEVRWASVNMLKIKPKDVVVDIGAGTGSVSIEMARKAYDGIVYALEKNEKAYQLLEKNREKLGAYNVRTKQGNAAELLQILPPVDKAFIGGSGKEMRNILERLFEANPKVGIVINAITLETLSETVSLLKEMNCIMQISCMNVSRNRKAGEYNLMMANNPVYIITGEKNHES